MRTCLCKYSQVSGQKLNPDYRCRSECMDQRNMLNCCLIIIEQFGLEGTSKDHLVQPCPWKNFQLDQVGQSLVQPDLECFRDVIITILLGNSCQCFITLIVKKILPSIQLNFSQFKTCFARFSLSFLEGPLKYWKAAIISPELSLLQAANTQLSQPSQRAVPATARVHGPTLNPPQQHFALLRTPELDVVIQVGCHNTREEGQDHFP